MEIRPLPRRDDGGRSVVLLEDDWDNRIVFLSYLEHRGWKVWEATEAGSALDRLHSEAVAVIVVDLGGTDGWQLLEHLGPLSDRPRLLCLSGDARTESRERAARLGADGYLISPLLLRDLDQAVVRLARGEGDPASAAGGEPAGSQRPIAPGPAATARCVILLLEDDVYARTIYRDMLNFAGFEVVAVCDGIEGLRYAEARLPDVVVTDLHMPGMSGVEVARTLRDSADHPPVIIAVTADSFKIGHHVSGDPRLFDEMLIKPVSPGVLLRAVRTHAPGGDNGVH